MIRVELEINPPVECTDTELREWVEYCTGNIGAISMDNPLMDYDLEATDVTVY